MAYEEFCIEFSKINYKNKSFYDSLRYYKITYNFDEILITT